MSKDPGPEDPALVQPLEGGALCDRSNFSLLLEYWSVGVLDNRTHSEHLPRMNPRDRRDYLPMDVKKFEPLLHNSNTPILLEFFKAEPSVYDLAQRTRVSHVRLNEMVDLGVRRDLLCHLTLSPFDESHPVPAFRIGMIGRDANI